MTAVAFPPQHVEWPLARVVADAGLRQCHLAETEKYAHVTYFFNGGREEPFEGEDRELVPSPKVATYDLQPEMSAAGVADETAKADRVRRYAFVVLNLANGDMVGHTGRAGAAVEAAETVDAAVGRGRGGARRRRVRRRHRRPRQRRGDDRSGDGRADDRAHARTTCPSSWPARRRARA